MKEEVLYAYQDAISRGRRSFRGRFTMFGVTIKHFLFPSSRGTADIYVDDKYPLGRLARRVHKILPHYSTEEVLMLLILLGNKLEQGELYPNLSRKLEERFRQFEKELP